MVAANTAAGASNSGGGPVGNYIDMRMAFTIILTLLMSIAGTLAWGTYNLTQDNARDIAGLKAQIAAVGKDVSEIKIEVNRSHP